MSNELTKASKKHHIKTAGLEWCPFCKAGFNEQNNNTINNRVVEYGELDPVENGDIQHKGRCLKCGREWIDIFRLVDMYPIAIPSRFEKFVEERKECPTPLELRAYAELVISDRKKTVLSQNTISYIGLHIIDCKTCSPFLKGIMLSLKDRKESK